MTATLSTAPHVALAPGAIIGNKYRIDGVLGEGGMGIVLSAMHIELDLPVAIKVVRDELASDEQTVASLIFEARAAARMRGAHIVRVLDVARLDTGAPYIVMERLIGSDLAVTLEEQGVLEPSAAVDAVLQACEGLAEAHALGIVHRDLKPANLFLAQTPEGVVLKVLDFGISKNIGATVRSGRRSTLTKSGLTVGSPYYMSPEQMRASPGLDGRADIWSLGAILFELLTGRCPFEGDQPAVICAKAMTAPAPSLRSYCDAPAELDAIVRRCLEKDLSARFQTVTELAGALRDFAARPLAVNPMQASGIALKIPAHARPRSTAKTALSLLALGALLVSAGVAFWRLDGRAEVARWLRLERDSAVAAPSLAGALQSIPRPSATPSIVVIPAERAPRLAAASTAGPRAWSPPAPETPAPETPAPETPAPVPAPALRIAEPAVPTAPLAPSAPRAAEPGSDRDSLGQRYDL